MKSAREAVRRCAVMTCDNYRVLKVISELASDRKKDRIVKGQTSGPAALLCHFLKCALIQLYVSHRFSCCHLQAPPSESVFCCGANNSLIRRLSPHNLLFVFFCEFKQRSETDALPCCHLWFTLVFNFHRRQHQTGRKCWRNENEPLPRLPPPTIKMMNYIKAYPTAEDHLGKIPTC